MGVTAQAENFPRLDYMRCEAVTVDYNSIALTWLDEFLGNLKLPDVPLSSFCVGT